MKLDKTVLLKGDPLSKVQDDVSDKVPLLLQLIVSHHWHHFVVVFGQVEVSVLPFRQKVGHILKTQHNRK